MIHENKQSINQNTIDNYLNFVCDDLFKNVQASTLKSAIEENPGVDQKDFEHYVQEAIDEKKAEMKKELK